MSDSPIVKVLLGVAVVNAALTGALFYRIENGLTQRAAVKSLTEDAAKNEALYRQALADSERRQKDEYQRVHEEIIAKERAAKQ